MAFRLIACPSCDGFALTATDPKRTHRSLVAILDGRPFTPAQTLEYGAVDAVVAKTGGVAKAIELADHFGKRPKASIGAIKRAVYFGGSLPLPEGIKLEAKEFLELDVSKEGQELMLGYQAGTTTLSELPLYVPGIYDKSIRGRKAACEVREAVTVDSNRTRTVGLRCRVVEFASVEVNQWPLRSRSGHFCFRAMSLLRVDLKRRSSVGADRRGVRGRHLVWQRPEQRLQYLGAAAEQAAETATERAGAMGQVRPFYARTRAGLPEQPCAAGSGVRARA